MSKHIITDDDLLDLLEFLVREGSPEAEYYAEKLCFISGRDYTDYIRTLHG